MQISDVGIMAGVVWVVVAFEKLTNLKVVEKDPRGPESGIVRARKWDPLPMNGFAHRSNTAFA
jgi:hypothetical protein